MAGAEELRGLLAATARGDRAAFARLYDRQAPKLYALALRILDDRGLAQDCLQEGFMRIWDHAGRYDPGRAAPQTWMSVIVRRLALDRLRGRPDPVLDAGAWPEATTDADPLERRDIDRCLDELRPDQRRCVELAYLEGLTHPELAERLEQPLGTVKTWIRRALLRLRECLQT